MKKYILLILCSVIVFSCNQSEDPYVHFAFLFLPRDCNYAWMGFDQLGSTTYQNIGYEECQNVVGASLSASKLLIYIYTSNLNRSIYNDSLGIYGDTIDNTVDEQNLQIETQIRDNYTRTYGKISASDAGMLYTYLKPMEYRVTEVKNLTISSNVTLFGQAAGSSLDNYLEIYSIDPACIFSPQNRMLMGFDQESNMRGMSISEWLNMHPLAAALMYLRFKTVPSEAPVDAQIILKMEMAGGAVLRDTSRVITLLP